jgi:rubrerythrin
VKLYGELTEHVSSEAELLTSYRQLAEAPDIPEAARYLIRLVVEDEERHHRLFHEMTTALGNGFGWTRDPAAVPELRLGSPHRALEEVTARFLAAERADQKQLRALRKELRPFRDTSLLALLVELMEHDTAKHIRVFTFLRDHVARRSKR